MGWGEGECAGCCDRRRYVAVVVRREPIAREGVRAKHAGRQEIERERVCSMGKCPYVYTHTQRDADSGALS